MAAALMFQGTGSDVGKSFMVAGLSRAFANRGLSVRPFKPQNMSNNAAVTADGGEIGRAQHLQALAARVPASVHMNPVLLKPQSETGAQIVVHGRVRGTANAREYQELKAGLLDEVLESFEVNGFFYSSLGFFAYPISEEVNIFKSRQCLTLGKSLSTFIANFVLR